MVRLIHCWNFFQKIIRWLTVSIGQTAETNNAENRGAYNLGKVYTFFRFSFENAQGFEKMEKYYIIARKIVAILTSQNNI